MPLKSLGDSHTASNPTAVSCKGAPQRYVCVLTSRMRLSLEKGFCRCDEAKNLDPPRLSEWPLDPMTCVIMREEGHTVTKRRGCDDRGRETG